MTTRTTPVAARGTSPLARHRWAVEAVAAAVFALALVAYGSGASFRQDYVVLICTYSLLALGMYIPYIMSGSLSLAYNAYLGIGAYACGLISTRAGWSSLWGVPIGIVLSAAIAVVLGLATRRLTGFYLAGVTLLFAVAFQVFLLDRVSLTGGPVGMPVRRPHAFGYTFTRYDIMIGAVVLVWIVGLLLSRLRQSPFGVVVRLRKDVPQVVESSGISSGTIGVVSLAVGAAIGSVGGSLFGMMGGVAQPESFGLHIIFLAIFMPLLGGQRSPWGAVIGAVLVVVFTFELHILSDAGTLFFAIAILLVLRFAPLGLLGLGTPLLRLLTRLRMGRTPGGEGS
ncbi:branched-chain amino acid ABC transporter permease [Nakamurella silvestris]|nr:branched-chain amino acid ABC transporter permease [Nakamurella silvestris]